MSPRIHTTGNRRPHIVHQGYRYQSAPWAKLESPVSRFRKAWKQTPWFERTLCFYIVAGTVGTIVYCFTGA